jgi:hypothetical protein
MRLSVGHISSQINNLRPLLILSTAIVTLIRKARRMSMIPDFNGHHFEKTFASSQHQRRERYRCARCEMTAEIRNDGVTFFGNGSATSMSLDISLAMSLVPACHGAVLSAERRMS